MTKFKLWMLVTGIFALQSCSVNTETTYYKDAATSMESNILMDQSALGLLSVMGNQSGSLAQSKSLSNLSTDWKSLYDIQKDGKVTLNGDSVKVLKKMFLKLNKDKGEVYGLSLKYDKLVPSEIASLFAQNKQLKNLPLQNVAKWDGKTLTIDTDKFNTTEFLSEMSKNSKDGAIAQPKTKSDSVEVYGRQMAQGLLGMMKMFNMNFTSTMKFQKPITSITGQHDFLKQIDNKTIQINVRTKELLDDGKTLTHKDKKIVLTTE